MASTHEHNDWDDPDSDKADNEDKRALLSALVVIVAVWGAAFLLT
jgi:hypothetical protein